ncbi:winged helix-turn-helix domain-containing protein [Lacrimispora saccharolytica]|uniref:Transcriptional regulator, ModE family n=1 Tax=Lacrimispora saccharolytica (strain ATCC 35040 / DSM 2544 / NRCC 2533 / WM1) TaxID=610130 RepID=D9R7C7_LACSW|nr:LysR family transcriptional regulator [Lacrimispora saccharolytica]ADL03656.1 putative transcriptional regulator, ModE family [[Clostridium] saccharolyticum WM1]QRV18204.1 LysR family transcriptional regulator [Lacrimispora saccharolytica]
MKDTKKEERTLKYHLKLRIYYEERNFGPGVASLMKLVRERGSLSAACQELNMAYSKAWKIINKAEEDLGFSLMEGRRGGENGGTTVLTEEGETFLDRYLAFTEEAEAALEELFYKYFTG